MYELTYILRCQHCSLPIPLLNTIPSEKDARRQKWPTDAGTLQLVCPHCNASAQFREDEVRIGASDNTDDTKTRATTTLVTVSIICRKEDCRQIYKVFLRQAADVSEGELDYILKKADPPVRCPNGHSLVLHGGEMKVLHS